MTPSLTLGLVLVLAQVLPFLALGLGVDDMFVMAFDFKFNPLKDAEHMVRTRPDARNAATREE